jgi:hypothetical protein
MIVEPGALRTNFCCADTIKQMPIVEAYQLFVGTMRAFTRDLAGKQDGAPVTAARALDLALSGQRAVATAGRCRRDCRRASPC